MKIAFVAYGEKSRANIPALVQDNWYCINTYAEQRGKLLDKAVWATLLNSKFDIDMFVIISDSVVPFEMLKWAEFCSMHGIKFRLNIDAVKWALDPYCDYAISQPASKRICPKGSKIERLAIQVDPLILKMMRDSQQWQYLVECYNTYHRVQRERREQFDKNARDYNVSRLLYDFVDADWQTIKRMARIFCLPAVVTDLYNLLEKHDQHDVWSNKLVPEFTGYSEFFKACWLCRNNWFITEVLSQARYMPTGFTNNAELETFVKYWRVLYDIPKSLTDIEAATSISYFLLMGIAPELRDVHLQLISTEKLSQ